MFSIVTLDKTLNEVIKYPTDYTKSPFISSLCWRREHPAIKDDRIKIKQQKCNTVLVVEHRKEKLPKWKGCYLCASPLTPFRFMCTSLPMYSPASVHLSVTISVPMYKNAPGLHFHHVSQIFCARTKINFSKTHTPPEGGRKRYSSSIISISSSRRWKELFRGKMCKTSKTTIFLPEIYASPSAGAWRCCCVQYLTLKQGDSFWLQRGASSPNWSVTFWSFKDKSAGENRFSAVIIKKRSQFDQALELKSFETC